MDRRLKRKIATLATFFALILLFCVQVTGVHLHMVVGLVFIALLALTIPMCFGLKEQHK